MKSNPKYFVRKGFTLLEVVIAVGLLAILVGMVFSVARSSLLLGQTIVTTQNEEMLRVAFFDFLEQRFSNLPGNARLQVDVEDSGSQYLSDITIQNVPLSFTWDGAERVAKAVQLTTVKRRSGFLDIVLRYYENEILKDNQGSAAKRVKTDQKPFAEIVLLTDVAFFEWRMLDGRLMEWEYDWRAQGRLPLQMELVMAVGAKGEEFRRIFWLPPKQSPESVIRNSLQNVANSQPQEPPPEPPPSPPP